MTDQSGIERKLRALIEGLDVKGTQGDLETSIRGIAYDSRVVEAGDLFVAVRGMREDGRRYIRAALERGASAVLAEDIPGDIETQAALVAVADSRKALAVVSAGFYGCPSTGMKLIGVTGTNGKTTTTLLLESMLKHANFAVGVLGTLAYRWKDVTRKAAMTTPESLDLQRLLHEMRQDGTDCVVMEASSHALALRRLEGCSFSSVVFTNLSQDHLDFHETMENYFDAKATLFTDYPASGGDRGTAAINLDDPYGVRLAAKTKRDLWTYSIDNPKARVRVKKMELGGSGIRALVSTPLGDAEIASPLLGRLNLYNALSAMAAGLGLGLSMDAVLGGLGSLDAVDGRLQRVPGAGGFDVVVDYAHTPDAMEKSLTCLRELTRGRLLVVFGCGGDRDRGKRPLMGKVAAELGDLVIVTSDNPRSESPEAIIDDIAAGIRETGFPFFEPRDLGQAARGYGVEADRRSAIELALSLALPGDMVFIGGKGHETYQIVGTRRFSFDDRSVVRGYFEASSLAAKERL